MRVISQDGTMDFPYDNALVSVYKGCINGRVYVRMQICGYDDSVDVADYSTEEKAKKAINPPIRQIKPTSTGVVISYARAIGIATA